MKNEFHDSPRTYTYKDSQFNNQFQAVYSAFFDAPKSMLEVAVQTKIFRANICRFVRSLRKNDKIFLVEKRRCKITGQIVGAYSTNPELKPFDNQLRLEL
jgi:hypothetical protein